MYYRLDQYPIAETYRAISDVENPLLDKLEFAFNEISHSENPEWPIELCLNSLILPYKHLSLDKEYDIFCYVAKEYHGSLGTVAAIKRGDIHNAKCKNKYFLPIIELPQNAIDPMEAIFCDGTPEGYLEVVLFAKLIFGFPMSFNIYSDQTSILFSRPDSLIDEWDLLIDVNDWVPKVKDSLLYLYMYEYEHGMEASNGRSRISLRCYSFTDALWLRHAITEKSRYPSQLLDKNRYQNGKHCCAFNITSIDIAEQQDRRKNGS
ncbi:hypothetical protein [Youxingia wuxianensis]|uniref:Uncharacterized protein n=1 Tax=Youxingia wuxianensis TaxID=2763678 RepID=A0A926EMJ7_9FIRM|nr:hypothetical protein [Youxingia wuxianensis]MBC8585110.1 hypothetical protein [Youxingia wuxianensis]